MNDDFEKRAKAFGDKHSYESKLHFKNKVEATRRLGAWVSSRLGFDAQTMADYTENLVQNRLIAGGLKAVKEAVVQDLIEFHFDEDAKSVDHKITLYLSELDAEDGLEG